MLCVSQPSPVLVSPSTHYFADSPIWSDWRSFFPPTASQAHCCCSSFPFFFVVNLYCTARLIGIVRVEPKPGHHIFVRREPLGGQGKSGRTFWFPSITGQVCCVCSELDFSQGFRPFTNTNVQTGLPLLLLLLQLLPPQWSKVKQLHCCFGTHSSTVVTFPRHCSGPGFGFSATARSSNRRLGMPW